MPTLQRLFKFVDKRARGTDIGEGQYQINSSNSGANENRNYRKNSEMHTYVGVQSSNKRCLNCKQNHTICVCRKFLNLTPKERSRFTNLLKPFIIKPHNFEVLQKRLYQV